MFSLLRRAIAALTLLAGLTGISPAASFQIQGVVPVVAAKGYSPSPLTAGFTVLQAGTTTDWTAALEGTPAWASLSTAAGTGAGSLSISLNTSALAAGTYSSALVLTSGGTISRQAFTLSVILPTVVKMEADYTRPYIYAISRGATTPFPGHLLFFNTTTESVEKVLPIGNNPTDLDISYGEGVIYVTNHGAATGSIRVVNPVTAAEVRTINGGADAYRVNAGKAGRLVTEGLDQWIYANLLNSTTGATIVSGSEREGDADFDPTGRYYYRCDNNISNAHLTRYDMAADTFATPLAGTVRAYGTRNLILSGDGSRLFWNTRVHDT